MAIPNSTVRFDFTEDLTSKSGATATLGGGTLTFDAELGLAFDGATAIQLPAEVSEALNTAADGQMTMAMWVKVTSPSQDYVVRYLMSNRADGVSSAGFAYYTNGNTGTPFFVSPNYPTYSTQISGHNGLTQYGSPQQLWVMVKDGSSLRFYDAQVGANTLEYYTNTDALGEIPATGRTYTLGAYAEDGSSYPFMGYVRDLRIWADQALTQSEIEELLAAGPGAAEQGAPVITNANSGATFSSLSAAVAAASAGDTLNVPAGSFSETSQIDIDKAITISGAGSADSVITLSHNNSFGVLVRSSNVSISGIQFASDGTNQNYAVKVGYNAELFSNISFSDVYVNGSQKTALDINGITASSFTDVRADGAVAGYGVGVASSTELTFTNVSSSGNAWGDVVIFPAGLASQIAGYEAPSNITFAGTVTTSSGTITAMAGALASGGTWEPVLSDDASNSSADIYLPASMTHGMTVTYAGGSFEVAGAEAAVAAMKTYLDSLGAYTTEEPSRLPQGVTVSDIKTLNLTPHTEYKGKLELSGDTSAAKSPMKREDIEGMISSFLAGFGSEFTVAGSGAAPGDISVSLNDLKVSDVYVDDSAASLAAYLGSTADSINKGDVVILTNAADGKEVYIAKQDAVSDAAHMVRMDGFDAADEASIRSLFSVVDAGGDGSFSYDSSSGVLTYTGPSAAEVRAHFSAGNGVNLADGEISADTSVMATVVFVNGVKSALEAADATLQSNIDAEAAARGAADSTLQSNIDAEASTRAAADTALGGRIDDEEAARAAADTALGGRIDGVEADLAQELLDRAAADAALQTAIDGVASDLADEETARAAADSALDAAYKAADAALQTAIDGVAADLAQELLDRAAGDAAVRSEFAAADAALQTAFQAADATLQENIDAEASARAAADTAVRGEFAAADAALQTAFQAADATLQANIDALETSVNNHIALAVRRFTSNETLTASTAHTIAHGLGQQAVVIHVWDPSTGYKVVMDQVRYVDANTVEIVSQVSGTFEVVIHV